MCDFFVIKQKTADEMRISDWSSDVCTSDLGLTDKGLDFAVTRDNDGRSFSSRRVTVEQDGALVMSASASFQVAEDGPRHQFAMPDVPPPEQLRPMSDYIADAPLPERHLPFWRRPQLFEWRPVEPFLMFNGQPERSEEHTYELQSLMRISYAVFCWKKK